VRLSGFEAAASRRRKEREGADEQGDAGEARRAPSRSRDRQSHCLPPVACEATHVACDATHVACDATHVACEATHVACDATHVACEATHVACEATHVACEATHVACEATPVACNQQPPWHVSILPRAFPS